MRLLICLFCICIPCFASLKDALVNGYKRVDIILYGDYLTSNYGGYYSNNLFGSSKFVGNAGYINTQVGLEYMSQFFYNFRAKVSFRAGYSIFSPNDGSRKDFYNNATTDILGDSSIAMGESFLEYYDGDTAIKAGRFSPTSPWVNHLVDGIWVRNASFGNLVLEGIWAYSYGRVAYYEISPFRTFSGTAGWFNIDAHYYFQGAKGDTKDSNYITAFTNFIPDVFVALGGRAHWMFHINNRFFIALDGGGAYSFEDKSVHSFASNTFLIDLKATAGIGPFDISVGYVVTGDSGMGSLGVLGVGNSIHSDVANTFYTNIQPFFVWGGRAIKMGRDANLIYVSGRISLFRDALKLYAAYGVTFFNGSPYYGGSATNITQGELNVYADFAVSNLVSLLAYVSSTHFGKGVPNSFEINGGIRLAF